MKTLGDRGDIHESNHPQATTGAAARGAGISLWPSRGEWRHVAATFRWSPRETQVARLLLTGVSRKEIAHQLGLSLNTVHTHIRRALFKCRVADPVSLAWAIVEERDALRGYRHDVPTTYAAR